MDDSAFLKVLKRVLFGRSEQDARAEDLPSLYEDEAFTVMVGRTIENARWKSYVGGVGTRRRLIRN